MNSFLSLDAIPFYFSPVKHLSFMCLLDCWDDDERPSRAVMRDGQSDQLSNAFRRLPELETLFQHLRRRLLREKVNHALPAVFNRVSTADRTSL
jgi:hypothetical protein